MNTLRRTLALSLLVWNGGAFAAVVTVNTATDDFGSVTGNCSLREAIQSTNTNADFGGCTHTGTYVTATADVIVLPTLGAGGSFLLSRVGTDDTNGTGDLDISGNLVINGVSATNSVIRGDTADPDSQRHRLIHVISGIVQINDVTLRDGLEDGTVAGGGLRTEPGSNTTLLRVVVTDNIADGNAGGILNRGAMTISASTVSQNRTREAATGGGGIFNSPNAVLTIEDTRILDNTANAGADGSAMGGGIFSDDNSTLVLDNCVVDGNLADGRRILDRDGRGGGIFTNGGFTMDQSSVTNNEAIGRTGQGGGIEIGNLSSSVAIRHSVISFNVARQSLSKDGAADGGGIDSADPDTLIENSVISNNQVDSMRRSEGGGFNGNGVIQNSTIAANSAIGGANSTTGGGIDAGPSFRLINSTVINNQSDGDGGGINSSEAITAIELFSVTIAGNSADGSGGGVNSTAGEVQVSNSVLAGNTAGGLGTDCAGAVRSFSFNLVQTLSTCAFTANTGDLLNVNAGLATSTNNGGPVAGSSLGIISAMATRAPLPNSALVDAGNPNGCRDDVGQVLTADQIGRARADGPDGDATVECDIGAIEFSDVLFANSFE